MAYQGLIQQYRSRLPIEADEKIISLHEGQTPLIPLHNISKQIAKDITVYVKFEGLNPTGSFKDRGMTMAVTKAVAANSPAIICASTGNTSAAAAAYAARAGIKAFVVIPEGNIAMGKLAQAQVFGATIIQIDGNFDDGLSLVKQIAQEHDITIVNSLNPYRLQGQKTAAFEIVDALGKAPDYHCLPVGNAGNITSYWLGYNEYHGDNLCELPRMCGYQAQESAPLLQGGPVKNPNTLATAIRIGNPHFFDKAVEAQQQSQGWFLAISDQDIIAAQQLLAAKEGIFCEPASAASIAGLLKDSAAGNIKPGSTVVCTLTGNGLKDPDIVSHMDIAPLQTVATDINAVRKVIEQNM